MGLFQTVVKTMVLARLKVAEATFMIIKTEFVRGKHFTSLEELTREFRDYVHLFNHIRIHGH